MMHFPEFVEQTRTACTRWRDYLSGTLGDPRCTGNSVAPDLPAAVDLVAHAAIASHFNRLAMQDIQQLARILNQSRGRRGRRAAAETTAYLCRCLCRDPGATSFDSQVTAPDAVDLAVDISTRFASVLGDAKTAGGMLWFDFANVDGATAGDYQRPWARCDPAHPVTMIVVPAYMVDRTRLSHQIVYTGSD